MKALFGGSNSGQGSGSANSSNSTSQQASESGYSALNPELQAAFDPMGTAIGQLTNPNNPGVTSMFAPQGPTAAMTNATNNINAGFAPTSASISSDMAMQMNPYNESVINEINRQGQGQYSVLKQAMNAAGQGTSSNRTLLGANDIDLTRQNLIGQFLNGQFNTSMNNALTTLPGARAQDAANQMNTGMLNNSVINAQNLAPITALQAGTGMMTPFLQGGTATANATSTANGTSASSGSSDSQGGIIPGISTLFKSDRRLKEDVQISGMENGHVLYKFKYRGESKRYIGVMADEVMTTHPQAVKNINGFLAVDYPMIGVKFREARQ